MRWRQFFTPVTSLDFDACKTFLDGMPADDVTVLDVRQPNEYEEGHIPGARLIPLPQLGDRLKELNPDKPVVVYCAVGGRSRIASQLLAGKGFREVFNLSGGIRAWNSRTAVGGEDMGLMLFNGHETVSQCLAVAYGLEGGLREFYETMAEQVTHAEAKNLFVRLASIETKHQDRVFDEYSNVCDAPVNRKRFEADTVTKFAEGGLTAKEFAELYAPDWNSVRDIVSIAMAIEAQALDLYLRASRRSQDEQVRRALRQIAAEETAHLEQLGKLIEAL